MPTAMKRIHLISILLALTVLAGCGNDHPGEPVPMLPGEGTVELVKAFPGLLFDHPLDLQSPEDGSDRIFVLEQGGRIRVFQNDPQATETSIFLDISGQTDTSSGELGALGLAFHPNYASNGYFYVYYTPNPGESVLSRFRVSETNPNLAEPGSEKVLLQIAQPFTNHNGGQLVFGPDGFLYMSLGDGGSGGDPQGNAQNLGSLLGKILRLDMDVPDPGPDYTIPPDNPFRDTAGARPEIYAYGLRNPWRISFDPESGVLWAADVGQGEVEEIDHIVPGGNYGWNLFEGTRCFASTDCVATDLQAPVFTYDHSQGDKSITGGFVYRGKTAPSLRGLYVYADYISGRIWALNMTSDRVSNTLLMASGLPVASFGTDSGGELYLCSFDGSVYRFAEE